MAPGGTFRALRRGKAGVMGGYRARGALATLALSSVVLVAVIAAGTITMAPLPPGGVNTPASHGEDPRQVVVVRQRPVVVDPGKDSSAGDRSVAGDEQLILVPDVLIPLDPGGPLSPPERRPRRDRPTDPTAEPTEPEQPATEEPTEPGPLPSPSPPPRGGNGGPPPPDPDPNTGKPPKHNRGPAVPAQPADPAIPGVRPARPATPASPSAGRVKGRASSSSPIVIVHQPRPARRGSSSVSSPRARPAPKARVIYRRPVSQVSTPARPRKAPPRDERQIRKERHKATVPHRHGRRRGHHRR